MAVVRQQRGRTCEGDRGTLSLKHKKGFTFDVLLCDVRVRASSVFLAVRVLLEALAWRRLALGSWPTARAADFTMVPQACICCCTSCAEPQPQFEQQFFNVELFCGLT